MAFIEAGEMAQWLKLDCQAYQPKSRPRDPRVGRREVTPLSHPLISTCAQWPVNPHEYIHTHTPKLIYF